MLCCYCILQIALEISASWRKKEEGKAEGSRSLSTQHFFLLLVNIQGVLMRVRQAEKSDVVKGEGY